MRTVFCFNFDWRFIIVAVFLASLQLLAINESIFLIGPDSQIDLFLIYL